jgi:GNAT superfamily N-acetyltransferase
VSFTIRPGTLADNPEVQRMFEALGEYEDALDPPKLTGWQDQAAPLGTMCLVIEREQGLCGYLYGDFASGRLFHLFIDHDYRSLGLGTRLVKAFEKLVAKRGTSPGLEVTCLANNLMALSAYEKMGYRKHLVTLVKPL